MKKIVFILTIFMAIFSLKIVKAETFVEGKYISGQYISKKKDGVTYYLTLQFLKDSQGNIVYCLEPYTKFVEGKSYTSYEGDISAYKDLNDSQKRLISLIVYYGYGYTNRTTNKWYVITQYLIWETVTGNNGSVYFTDKLNGTKITKYSSEIAEIKNDVSNHEIKPSFIKDYTVNYEENLNIADLNSNDYYISTDYKYENVNGFTIKDIKENGTIKVSKKSNYYDKKVAIFDSTQSQDLIRPGNVDNPIYEIKVNVNKGNILLDINKEEDVYTIESDFSNTCYGIYKDDKMIDSVCTNEEITYGTNDLPYGDYEIKQTSNGIGYRADNNVYKVSINKDNNKPLINLNNYLIRNKIVINKFACKDSVCDIESNATFNIYDSKDNLVKEVVTDEEGLASIEVGYGTYRIEQVSGLDGYTLADSYNEVIHDEDTEHIQRLENNYIEREVNEEAIEDDNGVVLGVSYEEIPNTSVDNWFLLVLLGLCKLIGIIGGILVKQEKI